MSIVIFIQCQATKNLNSNEYSQCFKAMIGPREQASKPQTNSSRVVKTLLFSLTSIFKSMLHRGKLTYKLDDFPVDGSKTGFSSVFRIDRPLNPS